MANERQPSKKELKELRKLESIRSQNMDKRQGTIKWITIGVISLLFLVFFVGLVINGKNRNKPLTADGNVEISDSGRIRMGDLTEKELSENTSLAGNAKVTLVEYADIQCPACKSYHPVVKELLRLYPNDVKLLFKHFPLIAIHPNAMSSAIAAEAAGLQGKFFEFVDLMYERQTEWSTSGDPKGKYAEYAKSLGLDVEKFKKDLGSSELEDKVNEQRNEGIKNGVSGTPAFFLNGQRIDNPSSIEDFKKLIDAELAKSTQTQSTPSATPEEAPTAESLPLQ